MKVRSTILSLLLCITLALMITSGCSRYEDRISTEVVPEQQLYQLAKEKFANQEWDNVVSTVKRYERLYTSGPNIQELRLLMADALFEKNSPSSLILAKSEYQSFLALYPRYQREDYVWLQIARCSVNQMLPPNRDQQPTREAITDLENFIQRFPESQLLPEARTLLQTAYTHLSEHHIIVGQHYYSRGLFQSAAPRFKLAIEQNIEIDNLDQVLYQLVYASVQAADSYQKLHDLYVIIDQPDFIADYRRKYEERLYDARRYLQELRDKYPGRTQDISNLQAEINQISPLKQTQS